MLYICIYSHRYMHINIYTIHIYTYTYIYTHRYMFAKHTSNDIHRPRKRAKQRANTLPFHFAHLLNEVFL